MSMIRIPNETPEQRAERLTIARASAARWEAYFRSLGGLPPAEEARDGTKATTFPDLLATHDPDGAPR